MVWAVSLSTIELISDSLTLSKRLNGIGGLVGFGKLTPPSPSSALPPSTYTLRLYLNAFRGEPAISGFDWHFTATHNSSDTFVPVTGSDLQYALTYLHPGHG